MLYIVGADLIGMLVGFMLGVVIRNSAGAIVTYFSYWFVLPTLSMVLAANQSWFEKAQPWVDFNYNQGNLYDGGFSGQDWAPARPDRRRLAAAAPGLRPLAGHAGRGEVAATRRHTFGSITRNA